MRLAVVLTICCAACAVAIAGHSARVIAARMAPQQTSTEIDVTLSNPSKVLRLAIPPFAASGTDAELDAAGRTVSETLWTDINFEEEFDLVSRDAASKMPPVDSIDAIPYDRWVELGADFVVALHAKRDGAALTIDLQFVGVRTSSAKKIGYAQTYASCTVAAARACAHVIADDLHKTIRRLDGVAQTRLAFVSDRDALRPGAPARPTKEIYISDYDGENQRRITANQVLNLAPSWAPDGNTLAYVSYIAQSPDIFVRNLLEARPPSRPAAGTMQMENMMPAFSPDGTKIAFSSTRSGNWDIWVVNVDGTDRHNLTNNANSSVVNNCPTWSPTGAQIAFTSTRAGSNQIYVMNADGTGVERLTSDPGVDRPTWSPAPFNDIAYTSGIPGGHDINLVDVATRQVRVLTSGLGNNSSPTFAPNGRHVAFYTSRWGKEQIAIIDRKGNIQLRVTTLGANTFPSWSRTPRS